MNTDPSSSRYEANSDGNSSNVGFSVNYSEDIASQDLEGEDVNTIVEEIVFSILDKVDAAFEDEERSLEGEDKMGSQQLDDKREVTFAYFEEASASDVNIVTCAEFTDLIERADDFIDDLILEAEEEIGKYHPSSSDVIGDYDLLNKRRDKKHMQSWPSRRAFHVDTGAEAIDKFVQSIEFNENWLYCIDYLGEYSDPCQDYYKYQVKFSIPCNQYPVPQATASLFFTLEASRIQPPECPVNVYYQIEGNRFQHVPWKEDFHEEWLFFVVDAKLKLYRKYSMITSTDIKIFKLNRYRVDR